MAQFLSSLWNQITDFSKSSLFHYSTICAEFSQGNNLTISSFTDKRVCWNILFLHFPWYLA